MNRRALLSRLGILSALLVGATVGSTITALVEERPAGPGTQVATLQPAAAAKGPSASALAASAQTSTTLGAGAALQADFVRVVNAVRPSVVEISTRSGLGSGVIFDTKGDIVTNAHVVGNETSFSVSFSNGRTAPGKLVGVYAPDDLAVIRAQNAGTLRPAKFGNSSTVRVGNIVLAIGNPLGLSSSVTDGIVSFNGRTVDEGNGAVLTDLIQTSAPINPGNSGGALVNLSGKVIGVPTLVASTGEAAAPGLGFAIPSNTVTLIAPQLIANGKVTSAGRAGLGVTVTDGYNMAGEAIGVLVTEVRANGPAAKAGIVAGDLITAVNGKATLGVSDLQTVLAGLKPGKKATLTVTAFGEQPRTVQVVLGDLAQM